MGLTDLFSKLIVEHGSAEVQAKHIALFKDQLALADKKTALLESESAILKNENEKLKLDLEKSQQENSILRSKIQECEQLSEEPLTTSINIEEFTIGPDGFYTHPNYQHAICPKCLLNEKPRVVPMTQASGPWKCVFCDYKISPKAACASSAPTLRREGFVTSWRK